MKANDELSRVMGRYKLVVEGTRIETSASDSTTTPTSTTSPAANGQVSTHDDGEILLDLSTPEDVPGSHVSTTIVNKDLEEIGKLTIV